MRSRELTQLWQFMAWEEAQFLNALVSLVRRSGFYPERKETISRVVMWSPPSWLGNLSGALGLPGLCQAGLSLFFLIPPLPFLLLLWDHLSWVHSNAVCSLKTSWIPGSNELFLWAPGVHYLYVTIYHILLCILWYLYLFISLTGLKAP